MKSLGIDPGKNGAAVIVEDKSLIAWWRWSFKDGVYSVTWTGGEMRLYNLSELGQELGTVDCASVEGLFAGPARQAIVGTAEAAGELLAAVFVALRGSGGPLHRPMASRWRSDLLALPPRTSASQCDTYARQVITSILGPSPAWTGGHGVDAACIALWGAGVRGRKPQKKS